MVLLGGVAASFHRSLGGASHNEIDHFRAFFFGRQNPQPQVAYAYTTIPTYASGTIGFLLCSKDASTTFATPKQSVQASMVSVVRIWLFYFSGFWGWSLISGRGNWKNRNPEIGKTAKVGLAVIFGRWTYFRLKMGLVIGKTAKSENTQGASGESLRYYSTPLHAASFVLPEFCRKLFEASA